MILATIAAVALSQSGGCVIDADCKDNRLCNGGVCVARGPAAPSEPASVPPKAIAPAPVYVTETDEAVTRSEIIPASRSPMVGRLFFGVAQQIAVNTGTSTSVLPSLTVNGSAGGRMGDDFAVLGGGYFSFGWAPTGVNLAIGAGPDFRMGKRFSVTVSPRVGLNVTTTPGAAPTLVGFRGSADLVGAMQIYGPFSAFAGGGMFVVTGNGVNIGTTMHAGIGWDWF